MQKIILAINSHQLKAYAIKYACHLASLSHSKLTALFIETEAEPMPEKKLSSIYSKGAVEQSLEENKTVLMDLDQGAHYFLKTCEAKGIRAEVFVKGRTTGHEGLVIDEIIGASRFADLLVVDPEISLDDKDEERPSHLLKEILSRAECAVVLPPVHFTETEEIVFCYDGSSSSVFAMKQFAYLFPRFSDKKVVLLSITDSEPGIKDKAQVGEWLKDHYSQIGFETLEGNPGEELFKYFLMKQNIVVVIGAYGRTMLSHFLKKSAADLIIRVIDLPLFIAHH